MADRGSVTLVGAGPGDSDLLTLGGKRALEEADVVLYDRLAGQAVLEMIPPWVERIDVGKSSGRHLIPQEEINQLILERALAGKRVVRLKGGDPYLFGRGAEELELLEERDIPFRVIPGVTASIAVPAYGGIPVTHRSLSSSVHILTGHGKRGTPPKIHYRSLVELGGTLVFMMGVTSLPALCAGLLEAGMDPATPAALIENGTRPGQRRLTASVAEMPKRAREETFRPPSVLVVGEVCALAERFDWTGRLPLWGRRVLVTSPVGTGSRLAQKLRGLGCHVIEYPCSRLEPLAVDPALWGRLSAFRWLVFTSAYGVERFFQELDAQGLDARALGGLRLAVVGTETGEKLRAHGLRADLLPDVFDGRHLGTKLREAAAPGDRVLLWRAEKGAPDLPGALEEGGVAFEAVSAYRTVYRDTDTQEVREQLEEGQVELIAFTSASTVEGFARSLPGLTSCPPGFCIGESTGERARRQGMRVLLSEEATLDSMVEGIRRYFQEAVL